MRSRTEAVDAALLALVDRVTRRMRAKGRAGRTVVLRLRFVRYARATRSQTLPRATAATRTVLDTGRALLAEARPTIDRRGPTLIRVTVAKLDPRARSRQLDLPLAGPSLERALRGGRRGLLPDRPEALARATLLHRDAGLSHWLFPDEEVRPGSRSGP